MLLVPTRLGASPIEGIGLFAMAPRPIAKGTVTWRFMAGFDQLFTRAQIDSLPEPARGELLRYVYLHEGSQRYVFCLDNARFMNHTAEPNTRGVNPPDQPYGYDVATRDIAAGEELTCDYREFDGENAMKLG
jgi:uncharacterized protein